VKTNQWVEVTIKWSDNQTWINAHNFSPKWDKDLSAFVEIKRVRKKVAKMHYEDVPYEGSTRYVVLTARVPESEIEEVYSFFNEALYNLEIGEILEKMIDIVVKNGNEFPKIKMYHSGGEIPLMSITVG